MLKTWASHSHADQWMIVLQPRSGSLGKSSIHNYKPCPPRFYRYYYSLRRTSIVYLQSSCLRDKQKPSTQQLLQPLSSHVPWASIVLSLYSAAASITWPINLPLWKRLSSEKHNFGNARVRKNTTLEIIKFGKAKNGNVNGHSRPPYICY